MEYQKVTNLIDNKTADEVAKSYDDRITKAFKNSQENNSETVTDESGKEIPKDISPQKKDKKLLIILILIS